MSKSHNFWPVSLIIAPILQKQWMILIVLVWDYFSIAENIQVCLTNRREGYLYNIRRNWYFSEISDKNLNTGRWKKILKKLIWDLECPWSLLKRSSVSMKKNFGFIVNDTPLYTPVGPFPNTPTALRSLLAAKRAHEGIFNLVFL